MAAGLGPRLDDRMVVLLVERRGSMKALTTARLSAGLSVPWKVLKTVGVMESWSVGPGVASMAELKAYEWAESMVGQRVHSMAGRKAGQEAVWKAAWKVRALAVRKEKKMGESKGQRSVGWSAEKLVVTMAARWAAL